MGKKKKRRSGKYTAKPERKAHSQRKKSKFPLVALAFGVLLLIAGGYFLSQRDEPKKPPPERTRLKKDNKVLREKRPLLSPERFTGKVRRAYRIAHEIPEVLDRLYCYCRCRENSAHKNLLSCFVNNHASTWKICLDEAQLASRMYAQGATTTEIQAEIDRRFGK